MKTINTGKGLQNEWQNYQYIKTKRFSYQPFTSACVDLTDNNRS